MKHYYQNILKIYCLLVVAGNLQINVKANSNCATQLTANQASYILETQTQRDAIIIDNVINSIIDIPVVANILLANPDANSYSTISTDDIESSLVQLNNGFLEAGFQFNLCSTNEIPYDVSLDSIFYSNYPTSNEFIMTGKTLVARALNIYFVPQAIAPNDESVCGWASFPAEYYQTGKNWIVIRNDCALNGSTLIHEVGHFFNLYHTHQGSNPNLGITGREFANGSNCGTSVGDGLCDTPAEPYRGGNGIQGIVNDECLILCEHRDTNEDLYNIGYTVGDSIRYNYMSYAPFKCRDRFTSEQIERMKKSYLIDRGYLSGLCSDDESTICDPLRDFKALTKLYNSIGGPVPGNWEGVTFDSNDCVTSIELENAGLNGEIPIEISDLSKLTTLNLSNNNICGTLPESISSLYQLQILDLSNNQLSGEIPIDTIKQQSLSILDLSSNYLTGYVPHQLTILENLTQLKLANNDFSGCLHPKLDTLINNFNNEIGKEVDDFNNGLNICTNCNEDDWDIIKYIFENMNGRGSLWLTTNNAFMHNFNNAKPSDCNLEIDYFIKLNDYGRVCSLDFSHLGLSGQLPDNIGLLNDLTDLNLSNNSITNTIPESLINLSKLTELYLENNQLQDCIPVTLTKLCGQTSISLGDNLFPNFSFWGQTCSELRNFCEDDVSDYVLPGDFNNDKKVNNIDLLYWRQVRALEDTLGTSRENANLAWLPQYSDDWEGDIWGINRKHFDANGDSIICSADLAAFHQNFGKGTALDPSFNFDFTGDDAPEMVENIFELGYSSDGFNGFYLKIKGAEVDQEIIALIFSIDLGSFEYQDAHFDYSKSITGNDPVFESIQNVEGTNKIEVALVWEDGKPPPIDDPFGRMFITANDEGGEGGTPTFRIENINILNDSELLISSSALDKIPFGVESSDSSSVCAPEFTLNDVYSGGYTYNASDSITSKGYITGCTDMTFNAGKSVVLYPGFKTQHGVVFCAEIPDEPCEVPVVITKLSKNIEIGIRPNPSSNQTTLTYKLEAASSIDAKLIDVTGKPVIQLLNNTNKNAGTHQLTIDTSHLPVGIYYCSLKNKDTISTQKLLVVN